MRQSNNALDSWVTAALIGRGTGSSHDGGSGDNTSTPPNPRLRAAWRGRLFLANHLPASFSWMLSRLKMHSGRHGKRLVNSSSCSVSLLDFSCRV